MERDTSRDGFFNRLRYYILTHFGPAWYVINHNDWLGRKVNQLLINSAVNLTPHRPDPLSAKSDYTSWDSLVDRTWFGRHLPPSQRTDLPDPKTVANLFQRPATGARHSAKSTLLFSSFAEWFTDGFLLTDNLNRRRTHSNHQIDMTPIYGLNSVVTDCLRLKSEKAGQKGRLKSQMLKTGEYPLFLFEDDGITVKREFLALPLPLRMPWNWPVEKRATIFAFGGQRANTTPQVAMLNTLFLREHNRICGELEKAQPTWDDERVFQTARNIMIVLLLKIVIEEYINHISPYHFQFKADGAAASKAVWNRTNWFTVEFNLLYRWHSLVPDTIQWTDQSYALTDWIFNNEPLIRVGLGPAFDATSKQKAGEIGLFNTPAFLLPVEQESIVQGRTNDLATYNDYREVMSYPRVTRFEQISSDSLIVSQLQAIYGSVDAVEFYVGLFAEDPRPNAAVPALLGRMVAVDAFSQALTNPLLSDYVFNARTFSQTGIDIIENTGFLGHVLDRNVSEGGKSYFVSMTQRKGS